MRRARAAAAAGLALALALAAGGCKPTSLTPLDIDDRGLDASVAKYTGVWKGFSLRGSTVSFEVSGADVLNLTIDLPDPCRGFLLEETRLPILNDAFIFDGALDPQGNLLVQGSFASASSASGSFSFAGIAVTPGCPTSGADTFTVSKVPQP